MTEFNHGGIRVRQHQRLILFPFSDRGDQVRRVRVKCRVTGGLRQRETHKEKITVLTLSAMLFVLCGSADAQQTGKVLRIGFLDPSTAAGSAVLVEVFRQELNKLGWREGKNITLEYRFAEGKNERLPELVADLIRLKVDLVVASGTATASAAKSATTTIPIVMTNVGDPVGAGLIASLARPGGNVTAF